MICQQCNTAFEWTDEDRRIPAIFDAPDPKYCFSCRLQRKMAFYNRRKLYKRTCDLSSEPIVSIFSPDKPYKAYRTRNWYSDKWNPLDYGRDYDFSRPFFEQFNDLLLIVPQNALSILGDNVNSDYTNDNYKLKNCYLIFDGESAENSYYGETFVHLKNCMDFLFLQQSELCYEVMVSHNCYNLKYSRFCKNCSHSWFLKDCIGVKNSFGCVNLHQKEFCIFNKQKTEAEFNRFMEAFQSGNHTEVQKMKAKAEAFFATQPAKATRGVQNENVIGDNVNTSKNCTECYDCNDQRDCRYNTDCLLDAKDSQDIHVWGDGMEECYNCELIGVSVRRLMGCCYVAQNCSDLYYCYWCTRNTKNCFGCFGLTHKEYCILNKQYSKSDYEALVPTIIEHMKSTGEWGEFFPPEISPFGFNETMAMDYFPLTKQEALDRGWKWSDYEAEVKAEKTIPASRLPDHINDTPDDILNWAITCEVTGKSFKLIPQELKFYRRQNLPVPRRHPDQRHLDRLALKQPYKLWERHCDKCQKAIKSTYPPDHAGIVWCEECYLAQKY